MLLVRRSQVCQAPETRPPARPLTSEPLPFFAMVLRTLGINEPLGHKNGTAVHLAVVQVEQRLVGFV